MVGRTILPSSGLIFAFSINQGKVGMYLEFSTCFSTDLACLKKHQKLPLFSKEIHTKAGF